MHDIKTKIELKRYEGLKGKLIHLRPKTFELLNMCAKLKNMTLKKYLETLCEKQAFDEANKALLEYEKLKNK